MREFRDLAGDCSYISSPRGSRVLGMKFSQALGRALAAIYKTFDTDEDILDWLSEMRLAASGSAESASAKAKLLSLLTGLSTGWVSTYLRNEDSNEEAGIISEAIALTIRHEIADNLTRGAFGYALTSRILNGGVRAVNRTSRALVPPIAEDLLAGIPDPVLLTEAQSKEVDDLVRRVLGRRRPRNEVADPETVIKVKNAWLSAIRSVEREEGKAAAQPMSNSVKTRIAKEIGCGTNVVEAAMKRLRRACQHAENGAEKEAIQWWLIN